MSLPVSPRTRLSLTRPLDDDVLNALLAFQEWHDGETFVTHDAAVNITANQRIVLKNFEPPVDVVEEWIPLFILVRDSALISASDQMQLQYYELPTAVVTFCTTVMQETPVGITGAFWSWPTQNPTGGALQAAPIEFRTRRKENKETWKGVSIIFAASATVGTRIVDVFVYYKRRRL